MLKTSLLLTYAFCCSAIFYHTAAAQTPLSKNKEPIIKHMFTADPSARVFNGRIYLYTSHDEDNAKYYDMKDWRVFSSDNLTDWKDNGAVFSLDKISWATKWAWAPDCAERNGKYYFYYPVERTKIGVAVGKSPTGPFKDLKGKPLIDNATDPEKIGPEPIDPVVLTDDDGQAYMYFGCRNLRVVKLKKNMQETTGDILKISITGNEGDKENEGGFYAEAPWIFKRNGMYYFVYSNGWGKNSTLVYATGKSALGPFAYQGEIMYHVNSSTSHGAILEYKDKWYVFYHNTTLSNGNNFRRSVCVDELTFDANGKINKLQAPN